MNKALDPGRPLDTMFTFMVREGVSYRLRPEADIWLDAAEFERLCDDGARLLDANQIDQGIERLIAALQLYAGDYLPEVLYEDWTTTERERLLSLYMHAADRLAAALAEHGRYDESIDVCQRLFARDTCWERAYRWMMLSYAQLGNRPQALRIYRCCATLLGDELGVEPSPATTALYHQIVQVDP